MWLLETGVRTAIEHAYRNGGLPTAQQQLEYEARFAGESGDALGSRIMSVAGDTAEISVQGVMTSAPSFFAMLFGGGNTTYPELLGAIAQAEQDPEIKNVVFAINSPGGEAGNPLFTTLDAVADMKKPTTARVDGMAASAAYAFASQADNFSALGRASRVGSVGIVATMALDEDTVAVTSTKAPKKRPDLTTEEGKAVVREELDAMHELFVEAIARGRGTTPEKVNADFGEGAMLLAGEALERGMIDSIANAAPTTTARSGGKQPEAGAMDLKQLQAQHPDVYEAAVQKGIEQERDRVSAHLTAGEMSGDIKTALTAAKEGTEMTQTLQTQYMMAAANRKDINDRADDDGAADVDASSPESEEDKNAKASEALLAAVAEQCGVDLEV